MSLNANAVSYRLLATAGAGSFVGTAPGSSPPPQYSGGPGTVSAGAATYIASPGAVVSVLACDLQIALKNDWLLLDELGQGPTSARPHGPGLKGLRYFDTTLSAQIIYDGTRNQWFNPANGEVV